MGEVQICVLLGVLSAAGLATVFLTDMVPTAAVANRSAVADAAMLPAGSAASASAYAALQTQIMAPEWTVTRPIRPRETGGGSDDTMFTVLDLPFETTYNDLSARFGAFWKGIDVMVEFDVDVAFVQVALVLAVAVLGFAVAVPKFFFAEFFAAVSDGDGAGNNQMSPPSQLALPPTFWVRLCCYTSVVLPLVNVLLFVLPVRDELMRWTGGNLSLMQVHCLRLSCFLLMSLSDLALIRPQLQFHLDSCQRHLSLMCFQRSEPMEAAQRDGSASQMDAIMMRVNQDAVNDCTVALSLLPKMALIVAAPALFQFVMCKYLDNSYCCLHYRCEQ